jgi:hypothetical protein
LNPARSPVGDADRRTPHRAGRVPRSRRPGVNRWCVGQVLPRRFAPRTPPHALSRRKSAGF